MEKKKVSGIHDESGAVIEINKYKNGVKMKRIELFVIQLWRVVLLPQS